MKRILLLGGTGFIGTAIAALLSRRPATADFRLILPTRQRERAMHLTVLPTAEVLEADVHDVATLRRLMSGCDAVINLVGVLHSPEPGPGQPYGSAFARAHVELPAKIAATATALGVARVLHMSALGASENAPSCYLRSKAAGEAALRREGPDLTVFRPSVVFGRGDSFLALFARLARIAPIFPLAGAESRFQPVWVDDVANSVIDALLRADAVGQVYELGGPRVYSLRELVGYAAAVGGHPRIVIGLPESLAWVQARLMEFLPSPPMTRDNLRSLQVPSVCAPGPVLPFGRSAMALEAVAPGYLAP